MEREILPPAWDLVPHTLPLLQPICNSLWWWGKVVRSIGLVAKAVPSVLETYGWGHLDHHARWTGWLRALKTASWFRQCNEPALPCKWVLGNQKLGPLLINFGWYQKSNLLKKILQLYEWILDGLKKIRLKYSLEVTLSRISSLLSKMDKWYCKVHDWHWRYKWVTDSQGQCKRIQIFRTGTCNFESLTGRGQELTDALDRQKVRDVCAQETKWKGVSAIELSAGYKKYYKIYPAIIAVTIREYLIREIIILLFTRQG